MSPDLLAINLTQRYGDFTLELDEQINLGGIVGVFGPSGSGKSSLLRMIAGFERPSQGQIRAFGQTYCDTRKGLFVAAYKRAIAYVFQEGRLFSHLTVEGNLKFANKRRHADRFDWDSVIEAFDLEGLLKRKTSTLSGGETQRVALAQAILTNPALLLLDEPLSALDRTRKQAILPYLQRVEAEFGLPMLYVSHDVEEMSWLARDVMVMSQGQIVDYGVALKMLNQYGFQSIQKENSGIILSGKIRHYDHRLKLAHVEIGQDMLKLPIEACHSVGDEVRVMINAADVAISIRPPEGLSMQNALHGIVRKIEMQSDRAVAVIHIDLEGILLPVQITRAAIEDLGLTQGRYVYALVKTAVLAR